MNYTELAKNIESMGECQLRESLEQLYVETYEGEVVASLNMNQYGRFSTDYSGFNKLSSWRQHSLIEMLSKVALTEVGPSRNIYKEYELHVTRSCQALLGKKVFGINLRKSKPGLYFSKGLSPEIKKKFTDTEIDELIEANYLDLRLFDKVAV